MGILHVMAKWLLSALNLLNCGHCPCMWISFYKIDTNHLIGTLHPRIASEHLISQSVRNCLISYLKNWPMLNWIYFEGTWILFHYHVSQIYYKDLFLWLNVCLFCHKTINQENNDKVCDILGREMTAASKIEALCSSPLISYHHSLPLLFLQRCQWQILILY